jgi:hypothetical protein
LRRNVATCRILRIGWVASSGPPHPVDRSSDVVKRSMRWTNISSYVASYASIELTATLAARRTSARARVALVLLDDHEQAVVGAGDGVHEVERTELLELASAHPASVELHVQDVTAVGDARETPSAPAP